MRKEDGSVIREALVLLYDMTNRSLDARDHRTGITRYQSMAMERVRQAPGLTQNQLAAMLCTTKQYISQVVKRLEELGLMESRVPSSDGRERRLYLTQLGEERQDAWRADSVRRTQDAFGRLSEEEQEKFTERFPSCARCCPSSRKRISHYFNM
mgnify:CR=1 FL=1